MSTPEQKDAENSQNVTTPSHSQQAQCVRDYHQRSKHSLQHYAAGPETLDWDAQPDPFRHFAGAAEIPLPLAARQLQFPYSDLYGQEVREVSSLDKNTLSTFFELSLALSAWKQYGTARWSLRINPSSGNLHPTEAYAILPRTIENIDAGVYHYDVYHHSLQQRCRYTNENAQTPDYFFIGLSSIYWREAWKYGERAFRYCQHDVGHAMAALRYAATILGWQVRLLDNCSDAQISRLLGLDRDEDFAGVEKESPDLLLWVSTGEQHSNDDSMAYTLLESLAGKQTDWYGRANLLDNKPMYQWPVIDEVSLATKKPHSNENYTQKTLVTASPIIDYASDIDAIEIISQRRSAQAFDPNHSITTETLLSMLDKTLVRENTAPFDVLPWSPRVHLLLFVHRVEGLSPGVYMLVRNHRCLNTLQESMRETFDWRLVDTLYGTVPLYHLVSARAQNAARTLGCHQDIASNGVVSFSMLARFDELIDMHPWCYRQLHWEAGMIGQSLYLEAEAHGLRGTGIGCFFDDSVHEMLGLEDQRFQCLYQFTIGVPIVDQRITSLPPYGHLKQDR